MASVQTTISIDKATKQKAEKAAKNMNLTLAGVTRILLNDFAEGRLSIGAVYTARDENGFSAQDRSGIEKVIADIKAGKNLEGPFNSAEDFIASMKE